MSEEKEEVAVEEVLIIEEKEKTENELAQEFIESYNKLCEEHGYKIVTNPIFQARDDGTYSIVLQAGISKLPKIVE